jgi:hypothetical protein
MKMMKWALLGGAALAVTATSARADDLAALKAQIEALQSRVTQLEAQPQASMPSGYSLMSLRSGMTDVDQSGIRPADRVDEDSGVTISVLPTADAAPVAEVSVSGEIRTALVYADRDDDIAGSPQGDDDDGLDLKTRGRIFITGKTDTAVGEIGGYFRLQADGGGQFSDYDVTTKMNQAWGWWKFAPNWQLLAGVTDMTEVLQTSWDWLAAYGPVSSFGPSNKATEMMQLKFTSGPITFAIAAEDSDSTDVAAEVDRGDLPKVAAYLNFENESFLLNIVGLFQDDDHGDDADWALGGGAKFTVADFVTVGAAAIFGEGTNAYANNIGGSNVDAEFWGVSGALIFNIAPDTRVELGAGYEDYDDDHNPTDGEALGFGGGIYWDPVSQATVGVGATYVDFDEDAGDNDSLEVFFSTWLRFGN